VVNRVFAVERYDETGSSPVPLGGFPALAAGVRLTGVVHLPADNTVMAFVEGPDETTVRAAMTAAGWRVDRIGPAEWLAGVAV
jgi:hypothetical protein